MYVCMYVCVCVFANITCAKLRHSVTMPLASLVPRRSRPPGLSPGGRERLGTRLATSSNAILYGEATESFQAQ